MNHMKEELKNLDEKSLQEKIGELRRELFQLRLSTYSAHVKDYSKFKYLKKSIAQALTYLQQKSVRA